MGKSEGFKLSKGEGRYYSLKTPDNQSILHIHHTGSADGEIHLNKKFWEKLIDLNELINHLEKSYMLKNTGGDIRIVRYKK